VEERIRILVVDDHPAVRRGLTATCNAEPDMEVVGAVSTRQEAVDRYRTSPPDITLMDLGMEGEVGGIEAIQQIRKEFPEARIISYSGLRGDEDVCRALSSGAVTFLSKESSDEELISTIRQVHAGERPIPPYVARMLAERLTMSKLSPREIEVVTLVADGLRNKEIAAQLGISEETVQVHMKSILSKLKVNDRTKAAIVAARRGIIHLH
jgi:RNA polymerase sigma factor (sigma-70 family)